jgi:hypothetical protein
MHESKHVLPGQFVHSDFVRPKINEGKNSVYLFVFCMNLGEINALLTIFCCQMKHFGYVIAY